MPVLIPKTLSSGPRFRNLKQIDKFGPQYEMVSASSEPEWNAIGLPIWTLVQQKMMKLKGWAQKHEGPSYYCPAGNIKMELNKLLEIVHRIKNIVLWPSRYRRHINFSARREVF